MDVHDEIIDGEDAGQPTPTLTHFPTVRLKLPMRPTSPQPAHPPQPGPSSQHALPAPPAAPTAPALPAPTAAPAAPAAPAAAAAAAAAAAEPAESEPPTPPALPASFRSKRPRSGATRARGRNGRNNQLALRPHEYGGKAGSPDGPTCICCGLSGDVPECEGRILGPFQHASKARSATPKPPYFVHRNCLLWAPKAFINDSGKLRGVAEAVANAKKQSCTLCKGKGASLACNFNKTVCCKPFHFRCALLAGASFSMTYEVMCPKHAPEINLDSHHKFSIFAPIKQNMLFTTCKHCNHDAYDFVKGLILMCANCGSRSHSRCEVPRIGLDAMLALNSWNGKHFCRECMNCSTCGERVDPNVYVDHDNGAGSSDNGDFSDEHDEAQPNDPVLCVACKHFATHVGCLRPGTDRRNWRCDLCLECRHCATIQVPREEWSQKYSACASCFTEIQAGGVICPVCEKVYRDHQGTPMIQCDYCDSWIHADTCAKLTTKEFQALSDDKVKFRCPICAEQKKTREKERKLKGPKSGSSKAAAMIKARNSLDALVRQISKEDEDVTFHTVRATSIDEEETDVWEGICNDLAIGLEVCRHCCSGGVESSMQFCTDCGESFHPFCHEARSGKAALPSSNSGTGARKKGRYGKPQFVQAAYDWRCFRCERFYTREAENDKMSIAALITSNDATGSTDGAAPGASVTPNGVNHSMPNGHHHTSTDANGTPVLDLTGETTAVSGPSDNAICWQDRRSCELCKLREFRNLGPAGRLIPWGSSTSLNFSQVWVHVCCVLCSTGVQRHSSRRGYETLLASRRHILNNSKRSTCSVCRLPGATVYCGHEPGCSVAYHFECARDLKVSCLVNIMNADRTTRVMTNADTEKINFGDIESLCILCPTHAATLALAHPNLPTMEECMMKLRVKSVLRVLDTQGFSPNSEPPRKKVLTIDRTISLRIGSLAVIRFGELIPEVDHFIVNGCLVPLGYCAARRYWSILSKGRRCTYLLEVSGTRLGGPKFVIRCFDEPTVRIEHRDPDAAWLQVIERLGKLVDKNFMRSLQDQRNKKNIGLEAFGLVNCGAVVSHIESLPMASLFSGRYEMKFQAMHRNNQILFYNSFVKNYKPPTSMENGSGSARSEGYLPRTVVEKQKQRGINVPSYENARTGLSFQLEVAREVLSGKKRMSDVRDYRVKPGLKVGKIGSNGRPKRRSASEEVKVEPPKKKVRTKFPAVEAPAPATCLVPSAKERTRILRSNIDGWGVFATTDIPAGEMIIEYVGEIIRPPISDLREKMYTDKGIGCYMFEIVSGRIVDATLCGNAARYINHSCVPNCFSKTIHREGKESVVAIFAKRKIQRGEELSYDYQFPFDDSDRVVCGCGAEQCKGFMN